MKRNIFLSLMAIMIAGLFTLGLSSCSKKPCEKDNFGTVIVTNNTGQAIYVDCTQAGSSMNDERMLGVGQSTEYEMTPGEITEWAIEAWDYPNGSWYTDTYYLEQCETHDDPWIMSKKSTSGELEKYDTKVVVIEKIR